MEELALRCASIDISCQGHPTTGDSQSREGLPPRHFFAPGGGRLSTTGRSSSEFNPKCCRNFFVVPKSCGRPSELCRPVTRHQTFLHQQSNQIRTDDAANLLDFRPHDRLLVGDDGQRFQPRGGEPQIVAGSPQAEQPSVMLGSREQLESAGKFFDLERSAVGIETLLQFFDEPPGVMAVVEARDFGKPPRSERFVRHHQHRFDAGECGAPRERICRLIAADRAIAQGERKASVAGPLLIRSARGRPKRIRECCMLPS